MTQRRYCSKECKKIIAQRALWLAVAQAAQKGMVTCPEAPTLDAALYSLTLSCAKAGLGIDDDLRASLAFSEASVEARLPRGCWRRDGFAYGIKRVAGRVTIRLRGGKRVEFADWLHDGLMKTVAVYASTGRRR